MTSWTFLRNLATSSVKRFLEHNSLDFAASIAYRVLFSLFPLAIVLVGIFGLVARLTGAQPDVVDQLVGQVPLTEEGRDELRRLLLAATSDLSSLGLLGIVGLVWAASGMVGSARTAMNLAWGVEQRRSFVRGKVLDVLVVLGASAVVLLSVVLTVAFRAAEAVTEAAFDLLGFGPAAQLVVWLLGTAVPFLLALAVILFAYRVLPAVAPPLRRLFPGAVFAALVISVAQHAFALYLEHFGRYDVVYGSLGAVIAFLLFVYIAASVFLLGVHVARLWPEELEKARRSA